LAAYFRIGKNPIWATGSSIGNQPHENDPNDVMTYKWCPVVKDEESSYIKNKIKKSLDGVENKHYYISKYYVLQNSS